MSKLEELIRKIGRERGEENPFPDDFDAFLEDFLPNKLLKSETLKLAFDISDREMEALYAEAYTLYEEDQFTAAANGFRFLIILDPYVPRYWMGLGATQQLLNRFEKALHSYAVVTLLDSCNPAPHVYAHECYQALGNEEEAEVALARAREVQPC